MKNQLVKTCLGLAALCGLALPSDAVTRKEVRNYITQEVKLHFTVDDDGDLKATFSDSDVVIYVFFQDENGKHISDPLSSADVDQIRIAAYIPANKFTASQRKQKVESFHDQYIYKLCEGNDNILILSTYALELSEANGNYTKKIAVSQIVYVIACAAEISK